MRQVMISFKQVLATACLVAWASSAHAQTQPPAETKASLAEKEALSKQLWDWYGQASDLHDAGKLSEAWALYQRVWRHRKTYDVATSLGGVCYQRGEYALAAHYFRIALDEMVPTASPNFVKEVEETFEKARAETAQLRVVVAPVEGKVPAAVTIAEPSRDLVLEAPYYLEAGEHELQAQSPGYEPVSFQVVAKAGATVEWNIDFGSGATTRAPATEQPTTVRHPWIVFPIGGLVAAGLGYGAWYNATRGTDAYDAAVDLELGPGDCNGGAVASSCGRALDLRQQARDAETRAWVFGSGAVLAAAATGIVYWLWETEVPISVGFSPADKSGEMRWIHAF